MDSFDALDSAWVATPNDSSRFSVTERPGYLRLQPGPQLYLLRDQPGERYLIDVQLDYIPTQDGDEAGLAVFLAENHKAELVSYFDAARPEQWTGLRLFRNGDSYEGYAFDGTSWKMIGRVLLPSAHLVGLVLRGTVAADFDHWLVMHDRYLQIGNLTEGMRVDIVDQQGTVLASETCPATDDRVRFDMIGWEIPTVAGLQVYGSSGNLLYTVPATELYPGDLYWWDLNLEIYWNGNPLPPDQITPIGEIQDGFLEVPMQVVNNDTETAYNFYISVQPYQTHRGHEWVSVAEDNLGTPGQYAKEIHVSQLPPGAVYPFWVRVDRKLIPLAETFEDYAFRLVIRS